MFIARVVGNIWATRKHPALENSKLLLVCPMDEITGKLRGKIQMAVDCKFNAGIGDVVLVMDEGNSARQIMNVKDAPVRTIIAGIIDQVSRKEEIASYT
ncbi:MAG: EutN/CcmL family microcompartment protein [Candidatus Eremiobacteraeota bacterium]|nr:EutN/CcmL family microcompartment protein [Candidatus Eremiobacteraeota bacterium]